MAKIKFGARLSRVITIQSQETARGTVLTGVTREGTRPYQRYAKLAPMAELKWSHVRDSALECERLGYHSVVLPYHLRMEGGPRYESWTLLSALAAITKRVKLHHLVICNGFFHAPWLAKAVATLDHVSEGRFMLGIGAGYAKEEFSAYGYPFPSPSIRIDQLDEALVVMKKMWTEERPVFKGKYYSINDPRALPKPIQKPYPPIILGGSGPKIVRLAGKHADIMNFEIGDPAIIRSKLEILEKASTEAGRNYRKIGKSWGSYLFIRRTEKELKEKDEALSQVPRNSILVGTPDKVIDAIQRYVDVGITYFTFRFEDLPDMKGLQVFAEDVIPAFK